MKEKTILGIDEAGIGPVFGPMIVSGVKVHAKDIDELRRNGVKDSKMFGSGLKAHKKRMDIAGLNEKYIISEKQVVISAEELDSCNMYELHLRATREILNSLDWDKTDIVQIEQVGGLKRETCFARLGFWHSGFMYESKADIKYPAVSLASIRAKVLRDNMICSLCEELDEEYISGYPNKNTEDFLTRYYEKYGQLPPGTRVSRNWEPLNKLKGQL